MMAGFLMRVILISLKCLKFMGRIYCIWPLDEGKEYRKIYCTSYKCLWWFYLVNYLIAMSVSLVTCYHAGRNFELATFSWMEYVAFSEGFVILINYKYYYTRYQRLFEDAERYLKAAAAANSQESLLLEARVLPYVIMLICITFIYGMLVVLYFTNPAVAPWDTLLTTAYYSPSIRSTILDVLLYFHQILVMFHSSVMVNLDSIMVLFNSICAVQLQVLGTKFAEARKYDDLTNCVRQHQDILRKAKNIGRVTRFIAAKTVLSFISYSVGAGLQLVNPGATAASLQRFSLVLLINCLRLILIATCADDLLTSSSNISLAVYHTNWYSDEKKMKNTKITIMRRCQSCVKICVGGIMPTLCLSYITGIISTAISYFMTLKIVTKA